MIVKSGYNIWNENECEASKQLRETADNVRTTKRRDMWSDGVIVNETEEYN